MFTLKFTPDFARQRRRLLAESSVPDVTLPASVEESLARITDTDEGRARAQGRAPDRASGASLWGECFSAVSPLILRAAGISLVGAVCASASAFAAVRILKSGPMLGPLLLLALAYFALNCLSHFANFQSSRLRTWAGLAVETTLVALVSRKLLRLSSLAAARQSSGNLKILITSDARNVGLFMDNVVRNLIPSLASLVVIAPLLVYFAGRSGLFGIFVMMLILPLSLGLNVISSRFKAKGQAELDSLTSLVGEWVKNVRLIRYLCWDEAFRGDVAGGLRRYMTVSVAQHVMACLIFGFSISWWMVATTGVVLGSRIFHFQLDLAGFFGSLWLMSYLAGYFTHVPNTIRYYGEAAPSIRRIERFLNEQEQSAFLHADSSPAPEAGAIPTRLVFEGVGFRYPDGKQALRDLSFEIDLSRKTAVIGEVGSGKTTLLKLLCGEFPPTEGRILVRFSDGRTRNLWDAGSYDAYRGFLAYVPQEAFVSSDLLSRNISLSEEADSREVLEAAYWAELEADIAAFPQGIAQELGESGVNLSGGQRQRLNLARAVFSRRGYLVLDDTLSAVDVKTETRLMERLAARSQGLILVTHRTGELMRVEEVLVARGGTLVERGRPAALAADPGSHFTRVLKAYPEPPVGGADA